MSAPNARRNLFIWLITGIAAIAVAWQLDNRVDAALLVTGKPSLQKLARWCSQFGEGWAVAIWGIASAVIFFLMKRPEIAAKIFFTAVTSEIAGLVAIIVRAFVGRTRPSASAPQGIYGMWHNGHWIVGKYEFSSFPSGHSAVATGLAAAVWLFSPRWGIVAVVYAVAVMWSRIAQQSHHLSDVVASTVIAMPIAVLMNKYFAASNEIFFEKLADKKSGAKTPLKRF